ncbi:MAG: Hsp20/alpha crystallin family protein [Micromonosporaceae bacterium]|nr:Hsp20/alpha crystallin family protein [Micromonosporaceae bacterium]
MSQSSVPDPDPASRRSTPRRRFDAFREMEDVYDRMGMLIRDFLSDGPGTASRWPSPVAPADIEETDDAYLVELDLPGVQRDDLSVELRDSELRVAGEIKERERTGVLRRKARKAGRFEHLVSLPGEADPGNVEARLASGVLAVRVGKVRATHPHHIDVNVG